MTRFVALALSLVLLAAGASAARAGGAKERVQDLLRDFQLVPLDGAPPPVFTLESLDGKTVSLGELRGRPVLVYFWHST
jgi:cytochrome oxidase Cu insertion factor (SCO1/SenC/PrrC family)